MSWPLDQALPILKHKGWLLEESGKLQLLRARVIDPQQNLDDTLDILLENGKIKLIGDIPAEETDGTRVLDLDGKIVIPGLFDMHVHLREPGREDKETILTGTLAAAAGGITGVACMPNTIPPIDNTGIVKWIMDKASGGPVEVHPVAAVTKERKGVELTDISDLHHHGVAMLSNDGDPVESSETMRRSLEYASMHDMVISTHSEDMDLAAKGVMREGEQSTRLGLAPWCGLSESVMVARDVLLALYTGARLHVGHISSWQSIEMVRWGKKQGAKITCEATPHHIALTDEACSSFDSNFKMNPPLGTEKDQEAIIDGLQDGTIDVIATDHAPHTQEEKLVEFSLAPNGVIGLETSLGVIVRELVTTGKLSWSELVNKMSVNPRRIMRLKPATIQQGEDADLCIIDPDAVWRVDPEKFLSKAKNSAFVGESLHAKSMGILKNNWMMLCPEGRLFLA